MARDSTESRFLEELDRNGGPQRVLVVGELWERAESRAVLQGFTRTLFLERPHDGGEVPEATKARAVRFSLVFFLCRAESLRLRASRLLLKEILRDVRDRTPGGGAVIGVIIEPASLLQEEVAADQELSEEQKAGVSGSRRESECVEEVSSLLDLLHSVFIPGSGRWPEVRAGALLQGQEESRRELQRLACEALLAADEQRGQRKLPLIECFSSCRWRRRRKQEPVLKDNPEEGTALTVLNHRNGDCAKDGTNA